MSQTNDASLVQLHIAEYQAVTTRASYWIVLQVGLLPVVPIYLALAAKIWQSGAIVKEVTIWATLAGLQIVGIVWIQTVLEQYALVRYIECYLRPLAWNVVKTTDFWGYEPYMIKHRAIPTYSEFAVAVLSSVLLIITCVSRYWIHLSVNLSWWDLCGIIVNVGLLIFLWMQTLGTGKIRREWSAYDKKFARRLEEVRKAFGTLAKKTQANL